jgi:hypothetical protein
MFLGWLTALPARLCRSSARAAFTLTSLAQPHEPATPEASPCHPATARHPTLLLLPLPKPQVAADSTRKAAAVWAVAEPSIIRRMSLTALHTRLHKGSAWLTPRQTPR